MKEKAKGEGVVSGLIIIATGTACFVNQNHRLLPSMPMHTGQGSEHVCVILILGGWNSNMHIHEYDDREDEDRANK